MKSTEASAQQTAMVHPHHRASRRTPKTNAICSASATSRWAVSETPNTLNTPASSHSPPGP